MKIVASAVAFSKRLLTEPGTVGLLMLTSSQTPHYAFWRLRYAGIVFRLHTVGNPARA